MKKFVFAVGLLLLAVAAGHAQQPTRQARHKGARAVQPTQQSATAQAPTPAAPQALPRTARAPGQAQAATKGQTGRPALLGAKGLAPQSFAATSAIPTNQNNTLSQILGSGVLSDPVGGGTVGGAAGIGASIGLVGLLSLLP
jgi:hypothetical protein